jgi:hypothetical protein
VTTKGILMKKIVFILLMLVGFSAKANVINIDLSNTNLAVGDTTQVTLTADSFESFEYFEFDLNYDNTIFSFVPSSFFSDIGTRDVDMVAEENPFGMTFLFFGTPVLAGTHVLARFNLLAIAAGDPTFSLLNVDFLGAVDGLNVDSSAQATAKASAVPEPSSLVLFSLVGLTLLSLRRKA